MSEMFETLEGQTWWEMNNLEQVNESLLSLIKQSHICILYLKHVHDIVLKLTFASFENLFTELIFKKPSDILHFMRDRI